MCSEKQEPTSKTASLCSSKAPVECGGTTTSVRKVGPREALNAVKADFLKLLFMIIAEVTRPKSIPLHHALKLVNIVESYGHPVNSY